ncbi:unnamed protein product [Sphagnum balticum]
MRALATSTKERSRRRRATLVVGVYVYIRPTSTHCQMIFKSLHKLAALKQRGLYNAYTSDAVQNVITMAAIDEKTPRSLTPEEFKNLLGPPKSTEDTIKDLAPITGKIMDAFNKCLTLPGVE